MAFVDGVPFGGCFCVTLGEAHCSPGVAGFVALFFFLGADKGRRVVNEFFPKSALCSCEFQ